MANFSFGDECAEKAGVAGMRWEESVNRGVLNDALTVRRWLLN